MKRARATKKEMQQRKDTVRQWVRKNPGGKVTLIAQATKLPVEITRQTLLKLCGEPTKRGFKMYRKDNRFYTYRPTGKQIMPSTEVSDKGNAVLSKREEMRRAVADLKKQTVTDEEFFVSTPQEVEQAKEAVKDFSKAQSVRTKVSFAQQAARLQILHTTVRGFLSGQLSLNALRQAHAKCVMEGEE